jgi:predicted component of type VI protein secretion system
MGVFRSFEHRIESLVEGAFGRAFRSHVQPVELARKLAKEMDEHKTVSVSRVYVPNEYVLYLNPSDKETLPPSDALVTELSDYLAEHARREGYALLSTPRVQLETDTDLAIGEFGIATRMVQRQQRSEPSAPAAQPAGSVPAPPAAGPPVPPAPPVVPAPAIGGTKVFKPPPAETAEVSAADAEELGLARTPAALVIDGARHELRSGTTVLGRSKECDITIDDANISRRHAEIRREDGAYWLVDLGSTNGVEVNGRRVDRTKLLNQDHIVLGRTDALFESLS